jgi:hypothetical protein
VSHSKRHLPEMVEAEIYLSHLAVSETVSASTHNQRLSARFSSIDKYSAGKSRVWKGWLGRRPEGVRKCWWYLQRRESG